MSKNNELNGRISDTKQQLTADSQYVAKIFNEMADEYDNLKDPWYSYSFGEIDNVLRKHFYLDSIHLPKPVALDIGCGTGIQSLTLGEMGYCVEGIDIADHLLDIAKAKAKRVGLTDIRFQRADAINLPFEDNCADIVNCCGPTLSFIAEWRKALQEMARCTKPGGRLLLEVEGKWTFDLFWEVINALIGNRLEYDKSLKRALKQFLPPWSIGHVTDYSFVLESGETVTMPLKLFAVSELKRELAAVGFEVERRWGIHCVTNLLPSTVLHHADAGPNIRCMFNRLAGVERRINTVWPFNSFACSLLVIAKKQGSNS